MFELKTALFAAGFVLSALALLLVDYAVRRWAQPLVRTLSRRLFPSSAAAANVLRVGVVGCSASPFDEKRAATALRACFDRVASAAAASGAAELEVVSGLTAQGVPKLAYAEARRRRWRTAGIACARAREHECWPCDRVRIVGREWGDESAAFLAEIDVLVAIGRGGRQAQAEYARFGKLKMRYDIETPSAPLDRPSEVENIESADGEKRD